MIDFNRSKKDSSGEKRKKKKKKKRRKSTTQHQKNIDELEQMEDSGGNPRSRFIIKGIADELLIEEGDDDREDESGGKHVRRASQE